MKRLDPKALLLGLAVAACQSGADTAPPAAERTGGVERVRIMTIAPGHFHAALVQKYSYDQVSDTVHVYAPDGPELEAHISLIEQFNAREGDPTSWDLVVYRGDDFLERAFAEKPGNVVVLAGDNGVKIDYLVRAVEEGLNVLSDKPMIIDPARFDDLHRALELADARGLVVNDVMPERHAITSILQRELARNSELFGELVPGTPEDPAITKESVHFFAKTVNDAPLIRPAWFFDVRKEGEAITDVATHLVDLVMWQGFPDQPIDYANPEDGVRVLSARTWPSTMTEDQFRYVTNEPTYPDFLLPYVKEGILEVPGSGEFIFTIRGVHARVIVRWEYHNPEGGDTHFSVMRGTGANLVVRQDAAHGFIPTLYAEPAAGRDAAEFEAALGRAIEGLQARYPGVTTRRAELGWEIVIPDRYREGHEDHFTRVTQDYLASLARGALPEWERKNLLTKYYITTQAYALSR